jgi:hypothetical protein
VKTKKKRSASLVAAALGLQGHCAGLTLLTSIVHWMKCIIARPGPEKCPLIEFAMHGFDAKIVFHLLYKNQTLNDNYSRPTIGHWQWASSSMRAPFPRPNLTLNT